MLDEDCGKWTGLSKEELNFWEAMETELGETLTSIVNGNDPKVSLEELIATIREKNFVTFLEVRIF